MPYISLKDCCIVVLLLFPPWYSRLQLVISRHLFPASSSKFFEILLSIFHKVLLPLYNY